MTDLFGSWPPSPADGIMGMRVQFNRATDHVNPCCGGIAIIAHGKGPHAAQLCCENCWRHLGWLTKTAVDFLTETVRLFGVPDEPFILTDATPGINPMRKADALPSKYIRSTSGLVLNGTNWDTHAAAYGEDSDKWNGKRVILYTAETTMKGKPTLGTCIKIPESSTATKPKRVAAAGGKAKRSTREDFDDEVPF
jgi:hypothetical protein